MTHARSLPTNSKFKFAPTKLNSRQLMVTLFIRGGRYQTVKNFRKAEKAQRTTQRMALYYLYVTVQNNNI